MNRSDLQELARTRLKEARGLYSLRHYSGAYYLAGYPIECALKACIAKNTQRFDFPDKAKVLKMYVHKPSDLMDAANLFSAFQVAKQANPNLQASWDIVSNWSEQGRYTVWSRAEAGSMIDAVGKLRDGVLPWIKLHW